MKCLRIKSFTILEALISLVLISIIIGLVYTFLNFMNKQMNTYRVENSTTIEYNLFNSTMTRDFDAAVDFSSEESIIYLEMYDGKQIGYYSSEGYIIRETIIGRDTFNLTSARFDIIKDEVDSSHNFRLELDIKFLQDTINCKYFLYESNAQSINRQFSR